MYTLNNSINPTDSLDVKVDINVEIVCQKV